MVDVRSRISEHGSPHGLKRVHCPLPPAVLFINWPGSLAHQREKDFTRIITIIIITIIIITSSKPLDVIPSSGPPNVLSPTFRQYRTRATRPSHKNAYLPSG